ncbi:MAG: hypothetical protein WC717_02945 [Candidatus Micrarchaeia archaeon]|jgi:hypothetical protein
MAPRNNCKQPHVFSGQSSLEFLYAAGMIVLMFAVVAILFYQSGQDASALGAYVETQRTCSEAAAQVEAVASAGEGASSVLRMPQHAPYRSFAFLFFPENRSLQVVYSGTMAGCALATSDISNGSGSHIFNITEDARIINVGGGVVVG